MKCPLAHWLLVAGFVLGLTAAIAQTPPLPPVEPQIVPLWPDGSPNNPAEGPRPTLEIYRTFAPARPANATMAPSADVL